MLLEPLPIDPASPVAGPQPATVLSEGVLISRLIEEVIARSGMSYTEVATRLGIKVQTLNQYRYGFRPNPSVSWLSRLALVCGGRLVLEMPPRAR